MIVLHTFSSKFLQELGLLERGKILRFITGTNKVPLDGYNPPLTITKGMFTTGSKASVHRDSASGMKQTDVFALPIAHTCFNQIILPDYPSKEVLKERLLFAAAESAGFYLT